MAQVKIAPSKTGKPRPGSKAGLDKLFSDIEKLCGPRDPKPTP